MKKMTLPRATLEGAAYLVDLGGTLARRGAHDPHEAAARAFRDAWSVPDAELRSAIDSEEKARGVTPSLASPLASRLERLDLVVPGAAARILDRWERQLDHRQQLEGRGLTYTFRIALAGLTVSMVTILAGIFAHQTGGIIAGGAVGTVALVYAFIRASSR